MFAGVMTTETTDALIRKAQSEANALALSQKIMAPELVPQILARVEGECMGLKSKLGI